MQKNSLDDLKERLKVASPWPQIAFALLVVGLVFHVVDLFMHGPSFGRIIFLLLYLAALSCVLKIRRLLRHTVADEKSVKPNDLDDE
jgi:hypothetical protein